jgi:hypothetical protein
MKGDDMSFWVFSAAGLLSLLWLIVHLTAGERTIALPLLKASELEMDVRETQYLCWHFTSVSIACMAGLFGAAAVMGTSALAVAGTALSLGFAIVGIGLVTLRGAKHSRVPQGWLFLPVAALGVLGLLA